MVNNVFLINYVNGFQSLAAPERASLNAGLMARRSCKVVAMFGKRRVFAEFKKSGINLHKEVIESNEKKC